MVQGGVPGPWRLRTASQNRRARFRSDAARGRSVRRARKTSTVENPIFFLECRDALEVSVGERDTAPPRGGPGIVAAPTATTAAISTKPAKWLWLMYDPNG